MIAMGNQKLTGDNKVSSTKLLERQLDNWEISQYFSDLNNSIGPEHQEII